MSTQTNRIDFHNKLISWLGNLIPSTNIYFQPPENIKMEYPAIVYYRNNIKNINANNNVYGQGTEYQVTVIDKNPDSAIVDKISQFPTSRFSRHYTSNLLNHDVFIILYK